MAKMGIILNEKQISRNNTSHQHHRKNSDKKYAEMSIFSLKTPHQIGVVIHIFTYLRTYFY